MNQIAPSSSVSRNDKLAVILAWLPAWAAVPFSWITEWGSPFVLLPLALVFTYLGVQLLRGFCSSKPAFLGLTIMATLLSAITVAAPTIILTMDGHEFTWESAAYVATPISFLISAVLSCRG
jgi:hypothetical protein